MSINERAESRSYICTLMGLNLLQHQVGFHGLLFSWGKMASAQHSVGLWSLTVKLDFRVMELHNDGPWTVESTESVGDPIFIPGNHFVLLSFC